jgi:NADH:ubiquinone oxidoreductase subunit 5 (subunit L)/multisubunit Na+/H+ antiporter MnhA subunit
MWFELYVASILLQPLVGLAVLFLPAKLSKVVRVLPILSSSTPLLVLLPVSQSYDIRSGVTIFGNMLRLDGLSLVFSIVISLIGFLSMLYSYNYMERDPSPGRYYFWMLTFLASMLLLVVANSTLLFLLAWELTSLCSFSLIAHWYFRPESLRGALKAILITELGSSLVLLGLALSGATTLSELKPITSIPLVGILLVIGALTKSAQYPFLIWLPDAMEAPTPVSAYLHAAAMVKAGVYLIARMQLLRLLDSISLGLAFSLGAVSMLAGGLLMLFQRDVKRVLAYSTISHLGLMLSSITLGVLGLVAGLLHFLNHAVAKAALFLCSGAVEHETGERDLRMLGGLFKSMPLTALAFIAAALSLSGVPPLGGFISKLFVFIASLQPAAGIPGVLGKILAVALLVSSLLTFMGLLRVIGGVFFGTPAKEFKARDPPLPMLITLLSLMCIVIVLGLIPIQLLDWVSLGLGADAEAAKLKDATNILAALALVFVLIPLLLGGAVYASRAPRRIRDLYVCGEDPGTSYSSSVAIYDLLRGRIEKPLRVIDVDQLFTALGGKSHALLTRCLTPGVVKRGALLLLLLLFLLNIYMWVVGI